MRKELLFLLLLILIVFKVSGINESDSLKSLFQKANDTSKIDILFRLYEIASDKDPDQSLKYLQQAQELADKLENEIYKARCIQIKGYYYKKKGDFTLAIEKFEEAARIFEKNGKNSSLAGAYNNLGAVYVDKGDYQQSMRYLIKALKICDKTNDEILKAKTLLNIGLIFNYQKNFKEAIAYYSKSLEIRKKIKDLKGISLVYNNMGITNFYLNNHKSAVENFKNSLAISQQLGNKRAMSLPLFNIAEIFSDDGMLDSAMYYYYKSYAIDTFLKDKASMTKSLQKMAEIYLSKKKYDLALKKCDDALMLANEVGSKEDLKDEYKVLSEIYTAKNDYKKALQYSNLSSSIKDTIYSRQSSEEIAELQTRYETEKKDLQLSKQKAEIEHQLIISRILKIGFAIVFLFTALVLYEFFQKKKAFKILEFQKKNITDSINYASRIQTALLPPEDLLNKYMPEHFILYLPLHIVSGDFYWITISEGKTIIAVADCTGHGVPGAFMSMLGFAYLNEIVNKDPDSKANEILNELRNKVKTSLHQNDNSYNKDGMDIALAIIDHENMQLQFSGANNPLLICRNSQIINVPPDKMPIGIHSAESESFTLNEVKLERNDIVYLFSDGYMDQFGGEKMKRMGKAKFEKTLVFASKLNIKAQRYFLEEKILEWMIDTDQIDDILVMGVKI
jgi:tetratricopeptide (TPR) repeat protein